MKAALFHRPYTRIGAIMADPVAIASSSVGSDHAVTSVRTARRAVAACTNQRGVRPRRQASPTRTATGRASVARVPAREASDQGWVTASAALNAAAQTAIDCTEARVARVVSTAMATPRHPRPGRLITG